MTILMTEEYWANTQLSIARYYGCIRFNGVEFKIVNKDGITLEQLSDPQSKHYVKDGKAINPGEPADLVAKEWIPIYKKLGRDKLIELLKEETPLEEIKRIAKGE